MTLDLSSRVTSDMQRRAVDTLEAKIASEEQRSAWLIERPQWLVESVLADVSPNSSSISATGAGKDNAASSRKGAPRTREYFHYLEPGSDAVKRKRGPSGSHNGRALSEPRSKDVKNCDEDTRPKA